MAYGLSTGHVTDDVTWPQRCMRSAILVLAWLLVKPEWLTSTCVYLENEKTSHWFHFPPIWDP